jgi:hypothetical protein
VKWGTVFEAVLMVIGSAPALTSCGPKPHTIGSVNTEFKLIGTSDSILFVKRSRVQGALPSSAVRVTFILTGTVPSFGVRPISFAAFFDKSIL